MNMNETESSQALREKTDKSLEDERDKTDEYLEHKTKKVEESTTEKVRSIRLATDKARESEREEVDLDKEQQREVAGHSIFTSGRKTFNSRTGKVRQSSKRLSENKKIVFEPRNVFQKQLIAEALLEHERKQNGQQSAR